MSDPGGLVGLAKGFYGCIGRLDIAGAGEYLADDVEAVFPFSIGDRARGLLKGREAVLRHLSRFVPRVAARIDFHFDDFHPGQDPDLLVMQFHSTGLRARGEGPYANEYVTILRFRDGKIRYWAEYFDPIKGSGGLDRLAAGR